MTDITELAQSWKTAAHKAKQANDLYLEGKITLSECVAETKDYLDYSDNPNNFLALVEALEKAQQRIAELEESNAQVIQSRDHYKRMTEEGLKQLAEARTVKLPDLRQIVSGDRYVWSDGVYNYSQDVKVALAAAGIKVEAE